MRNHNQWRVRGISILAVQTIFLLASVFTPSLSLSARQPDSSADEILDYHRSGKNIPVVSIDQIVSVEPGSKKAKEKSISSDDFLSQGALSPMDDAKGQAIGATKTQEIPKTQIKRYDSGATFGSNLDLFLAGALSKVEKVDSELGKTNHPIKRENHGDPKTTFNQSENRFHSQKQVQKSQEDNPPDDTTVGDDSTTETPDQTPQIILDLTGWTLIGQGGAHESYTVTYRDYNNTETLEQAVVSYNLITGEIVGVILQTVFTLMAIPDLTNYYQVWQYQKPDGTWLELYKSTINETDNVVIHYDSNWVLSKAVLTMVQGLSLETVKVPPYYTELYGWTDGLNWG